jgi:hypothetical protein
MKKIIALTVLAAIFTFSAVNATPVTSHKGDKSQKVVTTTHARNIKKMKDTPDQLLSKKQQNTASDNHSASV